MARPATPDDYYDHTPEPGHSTGDIWCGLPTYGALKQEHVAGIVITPACDLQNSKSETITYLPILSFYEWFATYSALTEIRGTTQQYWNSFQKQHQLEPFTISRIPSSAELADLRTRVVSTTEDVKAKLKPRILAGIDAISAILQRTTLISDVSTLATLFGDTDLKERCAKLIKNAARSDTHFLPARGHWAISDESFADHSLVMFRYPLTAPHDILELANGPGDDWVTAISEYASLPATQFFEKRKPVRIARLRPRFFADLLSRYTALYARVGAPDFSSHLVTTLASGICRTK